MKNTPIPSYEIVDRLITLLPVGSQSPLNQVDWNHPLFHNQQGYNGITIMDQASFTKLDKPQRGALRN